jgi:hypothetical protein
MPKRRSSSSSKRKRHYSPPVLNEDQYWEEEFKYPVEDSWNEKLFDEMYQDERLDSLENEYAYIPPRWRSKEQPRMNYDEWADSIMRGIHKKRECLEEQRYQEFLEQQKKKQKEKKAPKIIQKDPMEELRVARQKYEEKWTNLKAWKRGDSVLLPFALPVPSVSFIPVSSPQLLTKDHVSHFLFSQTDSLKEKKDKLKEQLLLWHSDRFSRYLSAFSSSDQSIIQAFAHHVAQCLTSLNE